MGAAIYMLTFGLILVGLYAVVTRKNVIKIIVGVLAIDYGINLLLVLVGYRRGGGAPILAAGEAPRQMAETAVDPLPQAMVLTSIVISLALTALMAAMAIRLRERYGTFDMDKIRKLRG